MQTKTQFEIFLKKINETHQSFYEKIGVPERTFSNQLKSPKGLYGDMLLKIKSAYPSLNLNWLLMGEGEILLSNNAGNVQQINNGGVGVGQAQVLNMQHHEHAQTLAYLQNENELLKKIIDEKERFIKMLESLIPNKNA